MDEDFKEKIKHYETRLLEAIKRDKKKGIDVYLKGIWNKKGGFYESNEKNY